MALILKDRVLESSTSTGTGSFTLTGAQTGYQSFTAIGNGNTTYYTIQGKNPDGTLTGEWEVGVGTWSTGGTLSRDTVLSNSLGTTALISFSAGAKDVFCDLPAQYAGGSMVYPGAGIPNSTGSAWGTSYGVTGSGSVVLSASPTLTNAVTIGSTTGTDTITLGQSTGAQTVNIATGVTPNGTTRTVNIGTNGATLSSTIVNIGSSADIQTNIYGSLVTRATTSTTSIAASTQITGAINIGGTSGTGTIRLGQSTSTQQVFIANGATSAGNTKTVNIGTNTGGGITNITIGNDTNCTVSVARKLKQNLMVVDDLGFVSDTGVRAFVTDAFFITPDPVFGTVVTGGGTFTVPVYYDGTDWRVG